MPKKYIVELKSGERHQLLELVQNGKGSAKGLTHAHLAKGGCRKRSARLD